MEKQCNKCDLVKLLEYFGTNSANGDGHNTICKNCVQETRRQRKIDSPESVVRSSFIKKRCIARNRNYIYDYLQDKQCIDCGDTRWRVLEFDHVQDTKIASISWMVCRGFSLERIEKEILKCEIRCANCHRIKSTNELGSFKIGDDHPIVGELGIYRKRNREFIYEILTRSKCVDCGISHLQVLEFDHVRGEKLYSITYIVHHGMSLDTLKIELEKCDVRCVNCHRLKTIQQFGWAKENWQTGQITPVDTYEPIVGDSVVSDKTRKRMSETAKAQNRTPPIRCGEDNNKSKLTEQQVREIRSPELSHLTGVELAKRYGVSPNAISRVRTGKTWQNA